MEQYTSGEYYTTKINPHILMDEYDLAFPVLVDRTGSK